MVLSVLLIPLLNFILLSCFGNLISRRILLYFAVSNYSTVLWTLLWQGPFILNGGVKYVDVGSWIKMGLFSVQWSFVFDSLSYAMLVTVTLVAMCVNVYSVDYMKNDPHIIKFFSYLSLFVFFMFLLILSNNFLILFFGWEGVGLCSYLLVSFWYTRIEACKSALKALLVNRFADMFFLFGIVLIYSVFHSLEFNLVFGVAPLLTSTTVTLFNFEFSAINLITLLLFVGACAKSAQLGLHTWLPDAMEGPTPVSALIHAATMVTAGVYLIIRCSALFELAPTTLVIIGFLGALTTIFAAFTALLQYDLKKIIAYSTCSQLGYMFFCCGLSAYSTALFHLVNHAFFKALLFLSAGSIVHATANNQDLRYFGGFAEKMPLTRITFTVGTIAILGIPFFSGFYSKDAALEIACAITSETSYQFIYWLGLIVTFLTNFYSIRLIGIVFGPISPHFSRLLLKNVHEINDNSQTPIAILATLSVISGYLLSDLFVGLGSSFWAGAFQTKQNYIEYVIEYELFIPFHLLVLPYCGSIAAVLIIFFISPVSALLSANTIIKTTETYLEITTILNSIRTFFDKVYYFVTVWTWKLCWTIYLIIDKGILEIVPTQIYPAYTTQAFKYTAAQTPWIIYTFWVSSMAMISYLITLYLSF